MPPCLRLPSKPGETNVGALLAEMLQHPQLSDAEVVFDGKAFYGVHAGCTWPGGAEEEGCAVARGSALETKHEHTARRGSGSTAGSTAHLL